MAQQIIIPASSNETKLELQVGGSQVGSPITFAPSASDTTVEAIVTEITTTTSTTKALTTTTTKAPITTSTTLPPSAEVTFFGNAAINQPLLNDDESLELGVRFQSSKAGFIKGIRFYKAQGATGAHTANLWLSAANKLASAPFTGESASGWQQALFSSPVAISANVVYTASVFFPSGDYISKVSGLITSVSSGPLSTSAGSNGVFKYGTSGYPTVTYQNSNYYVDVIFAEAVSTTSSTTPSPSSSTTTTKSPSTTSTTTNIAPPSSAIQGFGADVTGGSGSSTVYHVTNTNASGAGSLANGIGSNKTIVFDVSGTIKARINIGSVQNLTIDAYTSKQDITIDGRGLNAGDGMNIDGASNVIIRGLRFINHSNDGLNATGSSNKIVFDHCSSYGNGDGNIDFAATASTGKNFTAQWCIMGNNKGSGNMLITTQNASVHHNLFVCDGGGEGSERNPYAHSNYSPVGTPPNFDFRNNLIHGSPRYASGNGYGAVGNYVNNYYTSSKSGLINLCADSASCGKAYVSGNFNQPNAIGGTSMPTEYTVPAKYKIAMTDAKTAAREILQNVGPWKKSAYEQSVINSITIQS